MNENNEFSATDMATAAADGFRAGQEAVRDEAANNASGTVERDVMLDILRDALADQSLPDLNAAVSAIFKLRTAPPAAAVVMPAYRHQSEDLDSVFVEGYNDALDEIARLNPAPDHSERPLGMVPADHVEQPRAMVVPEGWLIEIGFSVLDKPFRFVDSKSHTPTITVILPACEVDDSAAWELRDEVAARIGAMLAAAPTPEPASPQTSAARDVLAERRRQVEAEGWTPEHDDEHVCDEIAALACFYAMPPAARDWDASSTGHGRILAEAILPEYWVAQVGDRRRELVKAGDLVIAEIERLDRAEQPAEGQGQ